MFTNVTNYENNPELEKREELVVGRDYQYTGTVYVPVGAEKCEIPARQALSLDPAKIAQAQADADYILHTLFGK